MKKLALLLLAFVGISALGTAIVFCLRFKVPYPASPVIEGKQTASEIEKLNEEEKRKEEEMKEKEKSSVNTEEKKPKEKNDIEKKEVPKQVETLDQKNPSGKYWLMLEYQVKKTEKGYEITGDVYDADIYAAWTDEVGSSGTENEEDQNQKSGLVMKKQTFFADQSLKVEADPMEGFEIEEKSLDEFFDNGFYGTFLFEAKDGKILKILDWYMNYSG